jgi:hypothetical protein
MMDRHFTVLSQGYTISHMTCMGQKTKAYRILVGKCERMRVLGRWRHKWQDNIEMDLKEAGWMWRGFIWIRTGTSGGLLSTL